MRVRRSVELLAACLVVPLALRLCSAAAVLRAVHRIPPRPAPTRVDPRQLARRVDGVLRRLPWIWRRTCLRRAAVLAVLLRREGRDARVAIGVRKSPAGQLEGHAWITCDGVDPYLEPGDTEGFTLLLRGPHAAS